MGSNPTQELKSIPFSNDTVVHINELGADREEQLCDILWDSPFSLRLDETTTSENSSLLTAHICYRLSYRQEMANEFLFSKYLETDIMDIFFCTVIYRRSQSKSPTFSHAPLMVPPACLAGTVASPRIFSQFTMSSTATTLWPNLKVHCSICLSMPQPRQLNRIKAHALTVSTTVSGIQWHIWVSFSPYWCLLALFWEQFAEFLERGDAALGEKVSSR